MAYNTTVWFIATGILTKNKKKKPYVVGIRKGNEWFISMIFFFLNLNGGCEVYTFKIFFYNLFDIRAGPDYRNQDV